MSRSVLVLSVLALFAVLSQAAPPTRPKEMTQCQAELGVTDDEVTQYLEKNSPLNTKMKCFVKCLGEKWGIFKDGKLVEPKVLADIKKNSQDNPDTFEREMKIYNECKTKSGSDPCETAAAIYMCVRSSSGKTN